jgi:hypothetical protein
MERNAIIATVLVILILLGYQWYMSRFEVPVQEAPRATTTPPSDQRATAPQVPQPPAPPAITRPGTPQKTYTPTAQLNLPKDITVKHHCACSPFRVAGARLAAQTMQA